MSRKRERVFLLKEDKLLSLKEIENANNFNDS